MFENAVIKPYTTTDLFKLILGMMMEEKKIPKKWGIYPAQMSDSLLIKNSNFEVMFRLVPSANRIHAVFYISGDIGQGKADSFFIGRIRVPDSTLKDHEAIAKFAGTFMYYANKYVKEHELDFEWLGYTARFDAEGYPDDTPLFSSWSLDYIRSKSKIWLNDTVTGAKGVKIYSYESRELIEVIRKEVASY